MYRNYYGFIKLKDPIEVIKLG